MSRRHRAKGKGTPSYIGFAWFDRVQWQRLTEVAADRSELDDTFEKWEKGAVDAFQMIERQGHIVEKVFIDVEALLAWCKAKNLPVNSESRAQYVSFVMRQRGKPIRA